MHNFNFSRCNDQVLMRFFEHYNHVKVLLTFLNIFLILTAYIRKGKKRGKKSHSQLIKQEESKAIGGREKRQETEQKKAKSKDGVDSILPCQSLFLCFQWLKETRSLNRLCRAMNNKDNSKTK